MKRARPKRARASDFLVTAWTSRPISEANSQSLDCSSAMVWGRHHGSNQSEVGGSRVCPREIPQPELIPTQLRPPRHAQDLPTSKPKIGVTRCFRPMPRTFPRTRAPPVSPFGAFNYLCTAGNDTSDQFNTNTHPAEPAPPNLSLHGNLQAPDRHRKVPFGRIVFRAELGRLGIGLDP